jgi:hypothetical protein
MSVPGSGSLSLGGIAFEKLENDYDLGLPGEMDASYGPFSLKDITLGGPTTVNAEDYDLTNQQSPNFPNATTTYTMGEFYSYDHDFQAIPCNKAMDVVFLLDYTGSMSDDMQTLKDSVDSISNKVVSESGGDYRLAAVLIDQTGGEETGIPSYWSGNNTIVSNLASANKYNSGSIYLSAIIPFANANKTDFDTKIGYLDGSTNSATSMLLGWGASAPEPNDTAIDRVLNNNLAGSFRSGVTRMIILITDDSPDGDGDDQFQGAEETTKMGTLSNQAVSNVCTISILGTINDSNSSDGTTSTHDLYNAYANNTGGLTNFDGDPSDIVDFIEDICLDIETGFTTFPTVSLPSTFIDSTPTGSVSASSVSDTRFDATLVVSDLNSNLTTHWKPWATNGVGTSYGALQSVTASKFTANAAVSSSSTITSRGFVYSSSSSNLATNGTSVTTTGGTNTYSQAIVNTVNQGVDNMGWAYCNSGYSQTPIVNYNNNVPGEATGNQIAYYSGSNTTGTKTQTINEGSVGLNSGSTYRLRGWFERKNNGGIVYSSNIVSFTVGSSFDFTASLSVGTASYYTTTAYGWSSQFPFSMGSISNISFNGSTLSAVYFQDNPSGTDYIYIYFSGTRKSFSSMYIGLQNLGASSTWSTSGSNGWRKASSLIWAEGSTVTISADY